VDSGGRAVAAGGPSSPWPLRPVSRWRSSRSSSRQARETATVATAPRSIPPRPSRRAFRGSNSCQPALRRKPTAPTGQITLSSSTAEPARAGGRRRSSPWNRRCELGTTCQRRFYLLWLYTSDTEAFPLGPQPVDQSGNLTGAVQLAPEQVPPPDGLPVGQARPRDVRPGPAGTAVRPGRRTGQERDRGGSVRGNPPWRARSRSSGSGRDQRPPAGPAGAAPRHSASAGRPRSGSQ
jgi:hypothetical protein